MATIQLGTTTSAAKLVNYVEKRAFVKEGYNVDIDYAKSQMRITREMFAKNEGIQAHHVIQSFNPDEITPEKANELGVELAEKIAPGHEVSVYTHDDKEHVHNHLVINSVNFETGMKYQAHGKEAIERTRSMSDNICKRHDLSIVTEHTAPVRYTLAEKQLIEKEQTSWKEDIRKAVNRAKAKSHDFESLKNRLKRENNIEMKLRGETLSFKHPDQQKYVRGKKLGYDYEKGGLEHEFRRNLTREKEWQELERTIKQSRPREETQEHAISERSADGKTATADRRDGKDTENERDTAHDTREESASTSDDISDGNQTERKRTRERDDGMEM